MGTNGQPPRVAGTVTIHLTEDGRVLAQCQVPNRQALLMMLESAKFDLERKLYEKERSPIEVAPPGIVIPG